MRRSTMHLAMIVCPTGDMVASDYICASNCFEGALILQVGLGKLDAGCLRLSLHSLCG